MDVCCMHEKPLQRRSVAFEIQKYSDRHEVVNQNRGGPHKCSRSHTLTSFATSWSLVSKVTIGEPERNTGASVDALQPCGLHEVQPCIDRSPGIWWVRTASGLTLAETGAGKLLFIQRSG